MKPADLLVCPVPPFAIATVPDTFAAVPLVSAAIVAGSCPEEIAPETSLKAGCETCGTPAVLIESIHWCEVIPKLSMPPNVVAPGVGRFAAGSVPLYAFAVTVPVPDGAMDAPVPTVMAALVFVPLVSDPKAALPDVEAVVPQLKACVVVL